MAFYVDVKGRKRLKSTFQALMEQATSEVEAALIKGGKLVRDEARANAPGERIQKNIKEAGEGFGTKTPAVIVGVPKKIFWAHMVEFGTTGHEIEPERKQALSWYVGGTRTVRRKGKKMRVANWQTGVFDGKKKKYYMTHRGEATFDAEDTRVTVKQVSHPGGPPQPFLFPAYNNNVGRVKELIADAILKTLKNAPKGGDD